MNSFDAEKLYHLLPSIHRIRDEEQGGPLKALLTVIAEQVKVMEENIEQLYDDQFVETCADWVVPYIGDLIGYRVLHGATERISSPRAEVAHTIALRRRKGTASVLEQLARDVTGWNARAVEFFQTLATTQHMNHIRLNNHYAPELRKWESLEYVGTAFDTIAHTVDVRRIASGRGRYNIPNVGLFLWPIESHSLTRSTAVKVDGRRWRISPLNHDMPLYNRPEAETHITHLAEHVNVPMPLSRRVLHEDVRPVSQYYGEGLSLALYVDDTMQPVTNIKICNLSGDDANWAHLPEEEKYAIDPVLGRVALPEGVPATKVEVTHHYGFGARIGGGEYERGQSFAASVDQIVSNAPGHHPTITAALAALAGNGVVEIQDNGRYEEALSVQVLAGKRIELRAKNECRPSLVLTDEMTVTGGVDSEFVLNGLLVSGKKLRVPATAGNRLRHLRIAHTTLVPGLALTPEGNPVHRNEPSLVVETANTEVNIERAIIGGLRSGADVKLALVDSILDATHVDGIASAGLDDIQEGGSLSMYGCTSIGKLHATAMPFISNSVLLATPAQGDTWVAPVQVKQRQTGCIRFSWLPRDARVPRRYRCQPDAGSMAAPRILSLRYGTPFYCWLSATTANAIRRGAEDEGEMGAYHHLHAPQREINLRVRLDEYLRAGLEAGIFYEI
ncbi:hypothetical protein C8R32_11619 [Nitrosospira sp. Nsp5]|uniref:Uncharacterized protein n=1 Tax=Nitrosospira multiformis TaxID=1231 RepID=A0ABY0TEM3_9PROT|nr:MULTISPECIES: hypothetical protein [Nitrosospira]PTR05773.1 hypothetical protein C8R32_11619 [Nitrosospira sp. Nsp5]SDQ62599.1 hypothetical protein SAMN05216402_1602 [Nitrosospira multiformis]